jgi:hypothetical protein
VVRRDRITGSGQLVVRVEVLETTVRRRDDMLERCMRASALDGLMFSERDPDDGADACVLTRLGAVEQIAAAEVNPVPAPDRRALRATVVLVSDTSTVSVGATPRSAIVAAAMSGVPRACGA